ncbi:MAG: hypothetical protein ACQEW8_02580 [Actinomycetota bacterium]
MTDSFPQDSPRALVPGAHRLVRVLGEHEGPFAGALVTRGSDVAVAADADEYAGWASWAFAGAEHVAGPLDVARRHDGHDVLLPWCTERVSVFLGRRRSSGDALTSGEVATLGASLLRGVREIGTRPSAGEWWLADDGRPLFVFAGGSSVRDSAATLIEALIADVTDRALRRVLGEIEAGLRQPRVGAGEEERWERELFEIAAPRPLRTAPVHEATRNRRSQPDWSDVMVPRREAVHTRGQRVSERTSRLRAVRDTAWAIVHHGRDAARSWRMRRSDRAAAPQTSGASDRSARRVVPRSRRRSLIVAGAAAAIVLCVGVLWPQDGPSEADAVAANTRSAPATPVPTADPETASPSATPSVEGTEDDAEGPVSLTPRLLVEISACMRAGDDVCESAVAAGSARVLDGRGLTDEALSVSAELLDDYGDLAVVSVQSDDGARRIVVLVRQEQNWLVRDIYDAADQPE